MYLLPTPAMNVQRLSNQFLMTTQRENEIDYRDVRPAINSSSNESLQNLSHLFKQSAPSQPNRVNNDPLDNDLRKDRKLLSTDRANLHQNPFNVKDLADVQAQYTFKGGVPDDIFFDDTPPLDNTLPYIRLGLNSNTLPIFFAGENQKRDSVKPRKNDEVKNIEYPIETEFKRFKL